MVPSDEDGCDPAPKPVQAAFSISVRSSRRRRSRLSRPPTPPSACEESAHYPVFNPEDPRHNPALRTTVSPDNADGLSQTAHLTGSRHWMQSLPGRSLRRARSGLQALRSGLHRRSANQNTDSPIVINGVWPSSDSAEGSSDQHERSFSSTVSEASTEEDYDFGTHLYRTGCNYPDFSDDIGKDLGSPSETHHSHHIISPALSTGAEAPLDFVDPLEPAPEDSPGEDLSSPVTPDSDSPSFVDTHQGSQEGQNAEEPTTASVPTSPAEDAKSPVQSPSGRRSLVASASAATAPLDETRLNFPVDDIPEDSQPQVAVEETDVTFVSHISAHNALELQQTFQSPVDDVDDGKTKDTPSKDTFAPESPQVENIAEEEESLPKEGMLKSLNSLVVPDVALGELGDLDYFLSLNKLDNSDTPDSKSSDEDPSPNSLSEDDANEPMNPWIPLDKDDRTSLLSSRDEYFLVDGKSTDLRPDRGDNPIKGERAFSGDGGLHSGPGLDRSVSLRTQEIPEIIGPGGPIGLPSPLARRGDREGSDSTEEYLVTYSLLHRHYFS